MNITFLIGNGFDLRMGMNTRFIDMYEDYIAQASSSEAIQKFKDMLAADAPNYKTWGDFEMAMAAQAKEFDCEDSFIECLRDFKLYMVSHLQKEDFHFNERISASKNAKSLCINEVTKSIENFYVGLIPNVMNTLLSLGIKNDPHLSFVSFNYTKAFDNVLTPFAGEVIHIHGTLGSDIVLGADNMEQVVHLPYKTTRKFERAFIKPGFNKVFDAARLEKARSAIANSDVICIYGMSLGKSDFSWTKTLKDWLISNKKHHLIYFVYDERQFDKSNWDAIIDEEEARILSFLTRICDSTEEVNQLFDQVHIPVGYNIFDVDNILSIEKKRADEERQRREAVHARISEGDQLIMR